MSGIADVTHVQPVGAGYVLVHGGGRQFAQLPRAIWDSLEPGETVPDEWAFEPEWGRLRKPPNARLDRQSALCVEEQP